jgi:serine phosphatase RsbU (regulator of sigma subunit)
VTRYRNRSNSIIEHSDSNIPIGLFRDQTFVISSLSLLPGDLLALITDGFTEVFDSEVFDSREREIGVNQFKSMLLGWAKEPLPEIYQKLRSSTLKFAKQTDGQTMFLIRRSA